jgi:hypothetical protein
LIEETYIGARNSYPEELACNNLTGDWTSHSKIKGGFKMETYYCERCEKAFEDLECVLPIGSKNQIVFCPKCRSILTSYVGERDWSTCEVCEKVENCGLYDEWTRENEIVKSAEWGC